MRTIDGRIRYFYFKKSIVLRGRKSFFSYQVITFSSSFPIFTVWCLVLSKSDVMVCHIFHTQGSETDCISHLFRRGALRCFVQSTARWGSLAAASAGWWECGVCYAFHPLCLPVFFSPSRCSIFGFYLLRSVCSIALVFGLAFCMTYRLFVFDHNNSCRDFISFLPSTGNYKHLLKLTVCNFDFLLAAVQNVSVAYLRCLLEHTRGQLLARALELVRSGQFSSFILKRALAIKKTAR